MSERQAQELTAEQALEILADPENWAGDPHDQCSTLHGHDTPFELAVRVLAARGSVQVEGAEEGQRVGELRDALGRVLSVSSRDPVLALGAMQAIARQALTAAARLPERPDEGREARLYCPRCCTIVGLGEPEAAPERPDEGQRG